MKDLRAQWRLLDEHLDWLSVSDHLYEVPPAGGSQPNFEALTAAAVLCADTNRARIGVLMFSVGFRNPAYLAKAATTLDHISEGRFEIGVGAGWAEQEALAFGYQFPSVGTRMDRLEDALPLIRKLLTQERTTHDGQFFTANDAANLPSPARGYIPIWVGGTGEIRTPRLAAAFADGWNVAFPSLELYANRNSAVDRACEAINRDPASLERSVTLGFGLTTDAGRVHEIEDSLRQSLGDAADRVMSGFLFGTPASAIEQVMAYVEAGAQGVNIDLAAGAEEDALAAYVGHVVPTIRAETAAVKGVLRSR